MRRRDLKEQKGNWELPTFLFGKWNLVTGITNYKKSGKKKGWGMGLIPLPSPSKPCYGGWQQFSGLSHSPANGEPIKVVFMAHQVTIATV